MAKEYETFSAEELAICLSHYDLGVVRSVKAFERGSRRAPKLVIEAERGRFLFKRRARGKDDLAKVAFTHQIQLNLAAENFPLPHLLGTRGDNNSMFVHDGRIYEMFEYVSGGGYDGSLESTHQAGRILGLYHKLLADFQSDFKPPTGSYHNAPAIHQAIRSTVSSLPLETRPDPDTVTRVVDAVEDKYIQCAERADALGLKDWPDQIVHGDWHPGNMLFHKRHVVAVIDYDAARLQQRVIDLANGALQLSIIGGGKDPSQWPQRIDESRFKRFMRGYDEVSVISTAELKSVPLLMCEAMIAEGVLPIAATGSFGRMEGFGFLQMIDKKTNWILDNLDHLQAILVD